MNNYLLSTRNFARHSIYFISNKLNSTCRIDITTPSHKWTNRKILSGGTNIWTQILLDPQIHDHHTPLSHLFAHFDVWSLFQRLFKYTAFWYGAKHFVLNPFLRGCDKANTIMSSRHHVREANISLPSNGAHVLLSSKIFYCALLWGTHQKLAKPSPPDSIICGCFYGADVGIFLLLIGYASSNCHSFPNYLNSDFQRHKNIILMLSSAPHCPWHRRQ